MSTPQPSPQDAARRTPSLGQVAVEVWRTWRALPWQGMPCYASAPGTGEFTWLPDGLYRRLDHIYSRRASQVEEDTLWQSLLDGHLSIYLRRNTPSWNGIPAAVLHQASGTPLPSGIAA